MNDEMITPMSYECPACLSKPGEECTQPTNTSRKAVSWFHYAREAVAWDAAADAARKRRGL